MALQIAQFALMLMKQCTVRKMKIIA